MLSIKRLFSANVLSDKTVKNLPIHAFRCHMLQLLKSSKAEEAAIFMKRHLRDFYENCRPSVHSAILSLQFVAHLKAK